MVNKWTITLVSAHQFESSQTFAGEVRLTLDGKVIHQTQLPRGEHLDYHFQVEDTSCDFFIRYEIDRSPIGTTESWTHTLFADGKKLSSD